MNIERIHEKLKNKDHLAVVALAGNERALVDDALKKLRQKYLEPASAELNHHRLVAGEDELSNLNTLLLSIPWLSAYRVIEVHSAEKMSSEEQAFVVDYLKRPSLSSVLILVFNKIDKRHKLSAALDRASLLYEASSNHELTGLNFVSQEAKALGLTINNNVAGLLLNKLCGDLLAVKLALEQLSLLINEGTEISAEHLERFVRDEDEQDAFVAAKFITEGNLSEALCAVARLRKAQENALKFLGLLQWQFRVIVHIRHCFDGGLADAEIRKQVSIFGPRFDWMCRLAKKRPMSFHTQRLSRLLEADRSLKSISTREPFMFIEKLVYLSAL